MQGRNREKEKKMFPLFGRFFIFSFFMQLTSFLYLLRSRIDDIYNWDFSLDIRKYLNIQNMNPFVQQIPDWFTLPTLNLQLCAENQHSTSTVV